MLKALKPVSATVNSTQTHATRVSSSTTQPGRRETPIRHLRIYCARTFCSMISYVGVNHSIGEPNLMFFDGFQNFSSLKKFYHTHRHGVGRGNGALRLSSSVFPPFCISPHFRWNPFAADPRRHKRRWFSSLKSSIGKMFFCGGTCYRLL